MTSPAVPTGTEFHCTICHTDHDSRSLCGGSRSPCRPTCSGSDSQVRTDVKAAGWSAAFCQVDAGHPVPAAVPPLTDQRIAEIEERSKLNRLNGWSKEADAIDDLLSELRRCQAREKGLREAISTVLPWMQARAADGNETWSPAFISAVELLTSALTCGGEGNE